MRRQVTILLIGFALTALLVVAAWAAGAHFNSAKAVGPDGDGDLTVSFKEAGLGNNQNIIYVASADATAEYAIANKGGNFPPAPTKQEVTDLVSALGTFTSGRNGSISASLTITPPPSTLNVPPGQRLVFVSVTYTNVQITDTTNGVTEDIPGTFSRTFVTLP